MKNNEKLSEIIEKDFYALCEKIYFLEQEVPNKLLMRLPILIASLTLLLTIFFKILDSEIFIDHPTLKVLFIFIIFSSSSYSFFCIYRVVKTKKYKNINIRAFYVDLYKDKKLYKNYLKIADYKNGCDFLGDDYDHNVLTIEYDTRTFNTYILSHLNNLISSHYNTNAKINNNRRKWFYRSYYSILVGMFITLATGLLYIDSSDLVPIKNAYERFNSIPQPSNLNYIYEDE